MIRALVVDDQEVVRAGFTALLDTQPDITVVASAADGAEAVRLSARAPAGRRADGRSHAGDGRHRGDPADLRRRRAATDRAFSSSRPSTSTSTSTTRFTSGASGFLLKDVPAETLFEAVRVIAAGEALLAPAITRRLIAEFARLRPQPQTRPDGLGRAHAARDRDPGARRRRPVESRDRRPARAQRRDRQDPRQPRPAEAQAARPRAGGRRGLRVRSRRSADVSR